MICDIYFEYNECVKKICYILYLYYCYIEDFFNDLNIVNVFIFFCMFRLNCFFYYFNSFRIGIRFIGS